MASRTAYGLETPRGGTWEDRAACRGHDPEWWSVVGRVLTVENRAAVAVCRGVCTVRVECHQRGVALGAGAVDTIWGGEVMPPGAVRDRAVVGTGEAARLLGCSPSTVRAMLADGRLPGRASDKGWLIRRADLVGR